MDAMKMYFMTYLNGSLRCVLCIQLYTQHMHKNGNLSFRFFSFLLFFYT